MTCSSMNERTRPTNSFVLLEYPKSTAYLIIDWPVAGCGGVGRAEPSTKHLWSSGGAMHAIKARGGHRAAADGCRADDNAHTNRGNGGIRAFDQNRKPHI